MSTPQPQPNELIEESQGLVRSLALKIFRSLSVQVDLDDLIAYGSVGLAEAARDYNAERGTKFSTFAYYRIRGAIYDGLAKMTWTSRARYRRLRYEQMAEEILQQEREEPDPANLSDSANWFSRVTDRLAVVYLASGGDEGFEQSAGLEDTSETGPQTVLHQETNERLKQLVNELEPIEQQVIQAVYFEGHTLQEAARQAGISKSWASRLHAKVLDKLAHKLRHLDLDDVWT